MLAHFGMIPRILTMIPVRENSEVVIICPDLWQFDAIWCNKLQIWRKVRPHINSEASSDFFLAGCLHPQHSSKVYNPFKHILSLKVPMWMYMA